MTDFLTVSNGGFRVFRWEFCHIVVVKPIGYFTQHAVGLFHAVISSDFMQDFSPGW